MFLKHPPKTGVRITNVQNVVLRQCFFRKNRKFIRKTCHKDCSQDPGRSGVLQHLLCCSKTRRRLPSNSQFETVKYISPKSTFQDGISKVNNTSSAYRRLCCINRSKGCISTCPIFPGDRKYLRFCIDDIHYQFRSMPFGLATAPIVFTKLMGAIVAHLRSQQISIYMYLDDWLLKNADRSIQVNSATNTTNNLSWSTIEPPTGYGLPKFGPFSQSAWHNFYHGYGFFYPSTYIPQSPWFNGSLYRFGSSWQTQDASHSVLSSVPVASTCGQCQTRTSLTEDRQFSSSVLHQSPRGDKVCSPVCDDMEDSALVSPFWDTAQSSSHSGEKECNSGSVVQRATNSQDDGMES